MCAQACCKRGSREVKGLAGCCAERFANDHARISVRFQHLSRFHAREESQVDGGREEFIRIRISSCPHKAHIPIYEGLVVFARRTKVDEVQFLPLLVIQKIAGESVERSV